MHSKPLIVRPFGKYGHAYELDRPTWILYQVCYYLSGAMVVLLGVVMLLAPQLADNVIPGTSTNPLFPYMPMAAAAFGIWLVAIISARGRKIAPTEISNGDVQTNPLIKVSLFSKLRAALVYVFLFVMIFAFGGAVLIAMVLGHPISPPAVVVFAIAVVVLITFTRYSSKK
jgi:hypothetical protein